MPRQKENVLIVERVASGSLGAKAQLRAGDLLLTYDGQPLPSPEALLALEENTFGKESIVLTLERAGQWLEIIAPPGKLDIETRPELNAQLLREYEAGRTAFEVGQFADAAQHWNQVALQIHEKSVAAWLYSKVGEVWEKLADWSLALDAHSLAWDRLRGSEDTAAQVQALVGQGRCHQNLSMYEAATRCFEQSLQLEEQYGHWIVTARILNHLSSVAIDRGNLDAAQDYGTRALEITNSLIPDSLDVASSLNMLGIVAWYHGELAATESYFTHALKIRERLASSPLDVAASLNNLGLVAWQRGDLAAAQDYYINSLNIKENLAPNSRDVALSLDNLGIVVRERGDLIAAQNYHIRALDIQIRLVPDSLDVAVCLNNLGVITMECGNLTSAQEHYSHALNLFERFCPGSLQVAGCLSNLGNIAHQVGQLNAAEVYHSRSVEMQMRLAPGSIYHSESLEHLGRTLLSKHCYEDALSILQQSVEVVEQQRSQISSPDARALLLAQHTAKYTGLTECNISLGQVEPAFSILERARARGLLELLTERRLDFAIQASPKLLEHQKQIDQERTDTYDQLSLLATTLENEAQIQTLHRNLRALERQQQELTTAIRQSSPHYAALQYPQPLDLKASQKVLDPGTLLLSFLVDKEQTFLFAVTSRSLEVSTLPVGREALQEQVRDFRRSLDVRRLEYDPQEATLQGYQLYEHLLQPAQSHIKRAKRLLLCPDGPLHSLPFAALVTKPGRKPRYLGTEKPLHTTVSMTVYAQTRQQQQNSETEPELQTIDGRGVKASGVAEKVVASMQRLLALGDPVYAPAGSGRAPAFARSVETSDRVSEDIRLNSDGDVFDNSELAQMQTRGLSLSPLPHTRTEVENLAQLFGEASNVKLGADATKTAALAESGEADIVHFACHGWLDPQMPLSSGLILSQPEALGEQAIAGDNGMLQAWEIMQKVRLKADLVVLSACQTGLGQELRGEGLIGLTRAFQYAGAKSLVVSLWEVNDASTSHFMQAFYTALKSGVNKDEALQAGVKALRADTRWNHPYFWSAFVLVGDCR